MSEADRPGPASNSFDPPRRHPRVPLLTDAWVKDGDQRLHVRTADLSSAGLRLSMPGPTWKPRSRFDIVIKLPDAQRDELTLACEVVWCSDAALGATFVGLTGHQSALIDGTI